MHLPTPPTEPEWMQPVMFYGKPLLFNPNNHRYTWDGKNVPSVTTILRRLNKPALIDWAANCAVDHVSKRFDDLFEDLALVSEMERSPLSINYQVLRDMFTVAFEEARKAHIVKRDAAGDVGTLIHDIAKAHLEGRVWSGDLSAMTDQATKALAAFEQWRSQHRIQPLALERRVMSARYMYAGTCDFYGIIDAELCVLDFKTGGSDIYDETWYQLAGYERALAEELQCGPLVYWAVHLNKNTGECKAYRRSLKETAKAVEVWEQLVLLDKAIRAMPKMKRAA